MSIIHLGYCRVSTDEQCLDLQVDALAPLCGDRIWKEKKSGATVAGRGQLVAVIDEAKQLRAAGSEVALVVYSLSRLGRRVVDVVAMVEDLQKHGIGFKSISESLDTTTAMGRCFLNIVASIAQMEAELIAERTKAGLEAAKLRGVKLGRQPLDSNTQVSEAKLLINNGGTIRGAAKAVGLSHTTLLRLLNKAC